MSQKPLTLEQIWGVPEADGKEQSAEENFCLLKQVKCLAWDNECRAEECIQEIKGE